MAQSAIKLIFYENRNIEKMRPKSCGLCGRKLTLGNTRTEWGDEVEWNFLICIFYKDY